MILALAGCLTPKKNTNSSNDIVIKEQPITSSDSVSQVIDSLEADTMHTDSEAFLTDTNTILLDTSSDSTYGN